MRCEWEQQIAQATRSGSWTSSLHAHLQECPLCLETELIAASLQEAARMIPVDLPEPGIVWRRALAVQRERILQRAVRRPFLIAGTLGGIYAVVCLLWGVFQLPPTAYQWLTLASGQDGSVALAGASLSAIVAIAGACVLMTDKER